MAPRLGCLLTVAVVACVSAVGSAAHGTRNAAAARIPAQNASTTGVANVQRRWAALAGCS